MKILPLEFTKDKGNTQQSFHFRQLKREGNLAIYEQTKPGFSRSWFEVIKIGCHAGYEIGGQYVEPAETYPSSEQWGSSGFTFHTLAEAEEKFRQLGNA